LENNEVVRYIWETFTAPLEAAGYELVEVECVGAAGSRTLRFYLDKPGGFTLDDCTAATQLLNPLLDTSEVLRDPYMLEVSSPGIARPVRKPADFEKYAGQPVRLETVTPILGRRRFTGRLEGLVDGMVLVACDGEVYEIHLENLKKANLNL
jgi:ribosome maturation factor RimP